MENLIILIIGCTLVSYLFMKAAQWVYFNTTEENQYLKELYLAGIITLNPIAVAILSGLSTIVGYFIWLN